MSRKLKSHVKVLILMIPPYVGWAIWFLVALICVTFLIFWPVGYGEASLIGRLIVHWPLAAIIGVVGLMIAGYFGAGLGLPTLFRDDPDDMAHFFGRSFGAGFGVSLVVLVIYVVIFFCDFISIQERIALLENQGVQTFGFDSHDCDPAKVSVIPRLEVRERDKDLETSLENLRSKVGTAMSYEGDENLKNRLCSLNHDILAFEEQLAGLTHLAPGPRPVWSSRSYPIEILVGLARLYRECLSIEGLQARVTMARPASIQHELLHEIESDALGIGLSVHIGEFLSYFLIGPAAIILLLMGCVGLTTPELAKRRLSCGSRFVAHRELMGYLLGCIGLLIVALITAAVLFNAYKFILHVVVNSGWEDDATLWFKSLRQMTRFQKEVTRFQNVESVVSVVVFMASLLAAFSIVLNRFRVSAGLGICMLFSVVALLYLLLTVIQPGSQLLVVGGLAVGLIWINSNPFKYRFPGMDSYYKEPLDLHEEDDAIERDGARNRPGPLVGSEPMLLDDGEVLEAWAMRLQAVNGGRKPKLVLVTATGAAYRASFWTTVVLERLEKEFPGFFNHVRLITGASGGMVGAAYVVAMLEEPVTGLGRSPQVYATDQLKADSKGDSLSPVVRKLIDGDLPRSLLPWTQDEDRGRTLEDQWKRLDGVTFANLRQGEKEGWRPSLVLSPMIVETGRRLLFSNLDLYGLTDIQARNRSSVSIDEGDLGPLPLEGGHRRLSRSAVEFFRAFPKTYQEFQVKVAVRMNASFPYISPAVSLPVKPPRRTADAGYYDNYGVNLAASWAFANRRWIRENTSGLALVQIRAYESEAIRKRLWVAPRETDPVQPLGRIGRFQAWLRRRLMCGAHALTTPLKSLSSARQWSMSYRNDEQVSLLGEAFNDRFNLENDGWKPVDRVQLEGENGWFDTFVFENPLSFGMNWLMTRGEIEEMKKCFDPGEGLPAYARMSQKNLNQLKRLKAWWGEQKAREPRDQDGLKDHLNGDGSGLHSHPEVEPILNDGPVAQ